MSNKNSAPRVGRALSPLEIVVMRHPAGSRYGASDYRRQRAADGPGATMYLLEQGVRLTGTDAWSWDAPFVHAAKKYGDSGDAGLIWGRPAAERRRGLLPPGKAAQPGGAAPLVFASAVFRTRIRGASAGWTRAVAAFDDALMASGRSSSGGCLSVAAGPLAERWPWPWPRPPVPWSTAITPSCALVLMHGKWGGPQGLALCARSLEPASALWCCWRCPGPAGARTTSPIRSALEEIQAKAPGVARPGLPAGAGRRAKLESALAYMAEVGDADGVVAFARPLAAADVPAGHRRAEVDQARNLVAAGQDMTLTLNDVNQGRPAQHDRRRDPAELLRPGRPGPHAEPAPASRKPRCRCCG